MPIRAENKGRYPKDWKKIRAAILTRANCRCEWCGAANHALGYWGDDEFVRVSPKVTKKPGCYYVRGTMRKVIRIVLTVAHLDHTPENCSLENLKALCQRCHNRYDAKTRASGIKQRRRAGLQCEEMVLK